MNPPSTAGSGPGQPSVRPIAQAVGMAVIAILPPFLTGAMAIRIRADLGFGPAALGVAVAWFFLVSSSCSTFLGSVVERLGTRRSLTVGALASATTLTGLALVPSYPVLLLVFVCGGFSNAITQPAVGKLLSSRIPPRRLGFAFGIKQSAIPAATLLGGLLVPTLAVAIGWRGTFATMGAIAFLLAILAWRSGDHTSSRPTLGTGLRARDMPEFRSLVILSAGGGLGAAASTSLGGFLIVSAVDSGIAEASAGLLMAAASIIGLTSRITLGWYMDLRPTRSRYGWISGLLFIGVPGYLLLSTGIAPAYVAGAALAYGGGWAWAGLFHYAAVSQNPAAPAAATGVVQVGSSLGGALGPLSFGFIAERFGFITAWWSAALLSLLAGSVFLIGRAHLRRVRRSTSAAHLREIDDLNWRHLEFERVDDAVHVAYRTTDNLRVTLYRLEPGGVLRASPPTRTGVILNLGTDAVALRIGGHDLVADPGEHLPMPASRPWLLTNGADTEATVAHVHHLWSTNNGE